jgi:hypothetical protein
MGEDDFLFTTFSTDTVVNHTNALFKEIYAFWEGLEGTKHPFQRYTTHALRHGALDDVSSSASISFCTMGLRSGLSLSSFSNIFRYLNGGFKNDSQCGRLFSDWYDVNCGGICPGNICN